MSDAGGAGTTHGRWTRSIPLLKREVKSDGDGAQSSDNSSPTTSERGAEEDDELEDDDDDLLSLLASQALESS